METCADVARRAIAAVDSSVGVILASQWVAERYRQFVRRAHLRHLRTSRELVLPAPVTAGTITATQGSATVTGDATAAAAWLAAGDLAGWHLRVANVWYEVSSSIGTTLTLAQAFTETTEAAATYSITKRYHPLPIGVRHATGFMHTRLARVLLSRTTEELDLLVPQRVLGTAPPMYAAEAQRHASGAKQFEFYPYSSTTETITYLAWAIPARLDYNESIPSDVDAEMLKEGTLIDIYRWEAGQAAKAGNAEGAALFNNFARQQATQWNLKDVPEATAAERAHDETQVILETEGGASRGGHGDIRTARDHIWSGGR